MHISEEEKARYRKNCDTVLQLSEILKFKLCSYCPDWGIDYGVYEYEYIGDVGYGKRERAVPDEIMEILARSHNLPWENEFKSHLTALVLHRAKQQMQKEENEYREIWMTTKVNVINELAYAQLRDELDAMIAELNSCDRCEDNDRR
jgi:hypothetical protein